MVYNQECKEHIVVDAVLVTEERFTLMKAQTNKKHPLSITGVLVLFALVLFVAACGTTAAGSVNVNTTTGQNNVQPKSQATGTSTPVNKQATTTSTQPVKQTTGNMSNAQGSTTSGTSNPVGPGPQTNACSGTSGLSTIRMLNMTQGWAASR